MAMSISTSDLQASIAKYRAGVEAQQGSATPYPENRTSELEQVDSFSKNLASRSGSPADILQTAQNDAAAQLKTFNSWNKGSYFGGLALAAVGLLPQIGAVAAAIPVLAAVGPFIAMAGIASVFVGGAIAGSKAREYNATNHFVNELKGYIDYAQAQQSGPPGQGNSNPAVCPQPVVAEGPPGQGNSNPAVCPQPPAQS